MSLPNSSATSQKRLWTLVIFGFVFIHGTIMQVRGPILPLLKSTFDISHGILGLVGPAATAGVVFALLAGGLRAGSVNMHRFLVVATGLAAIASIAVAFSPSVGSLLLFLGFQGIGLGLFRAFDRPILGHMYSDSRGRMFSYYTAVWAVGAASVPILTTLVVQRVSWRGLYVIFVFPLICCAIALSCLADPPHTGTEQTLTRNELGHLLRRSSVLATIVLVVLSGSLEGVIFTWFPYFARTIVSPATANTLLTYFFIAYIPGRLLAGTILEYVDNLHFVFFLAACTVPALYFTVVDPSHLTIGIVVTGLFVSGLFPLLY